MFKRRRVIWMVTAASALILLVLLRPRIERFVEITRDFGFGNAMDATARQLLPGRGPLVDWPLADAADVGLSVAALDSLRTTLAAQSTTAFLVARNGKLAYEWYAEGNSADRRASLAAAAKAVVGTMAVLALAQDGAIRLDERAAEYIPQWRDHERKNRITLQQLANHAAGLDDVEFPSPNVVNEFFAGQPAWKKEYFQHPERRFAIAFSSVPLLSDPGTEYRYSGIGYYVLTYALSSAIQQHSREDLRRWLARQVYLPLGIPINAWELSYGESYTQDGLTLYAIGSGASFTARAAGRLGQHIVDHWHDSMFAPLHSPIFRGAGADSNGIPNATFPRVPRYGWWGNDYGVWPSLPPDALAGIGAGDNIVLIVPSLGLVAVRMGGRLSGSEGNDARLERRLFAPLALAVR